MPKTGTVRISESGERTIEVPFTIAIDKQEKKPYIFDNILDNKDWKGRTPRLVIPTTRVHLLTGDYTLIGYEDSVTVERKSREDLWNSIFHDRQNFVEKLERMELMAKSFVMIECNWDEMLTNPEFAGGNPKSLSRTVQSWIIRYPTQWINVPNREFAQILTFRLLQRFWLDREEREKAGGKVD